MALFEAKYIQNGDSVDYIPATDTPAGTLIVAGTLIGVTKLDIKAGNLGTLATTGVFDVVKGDGVSKAFAFGANVYWHSGTKKVSDETGTGYVLIGKAVSPGVSAVGDPIVRVRIG